MRIKKIAKNAGEQCLHALWAFVPVAIMLSLDNKTVAGGLAGLTFALPREIWEQWPINRAWDTVLDITFFIIGGALAGHFIGSYFICT